MAGNRFGGSSSEFFVVERNGNWGKPTEAPDVTFWSGTPTDLDRVQYTNLESVDGTETGLSSITGNGDGTLPEFVQPDATVTRMWASTDGGSTGTWISTSTVEAAGAAAAVEAKIPTTAADVGALTDTTTLPDLPGVATDAQLPERLSETGLSAAYAGKEGTLPAESGPATTPGTAQAVGSVETQTITTSDPVPIGAWDSTLYGFRGWDLYSSLDNGRTWTFIQSVTGDPPSGITDIRPLDDGEVLLSRSAAGLWKSNGWATDPATATWTQVVATTYVPDDGTHGAVQGDINPWGLSVWGQYVFVTEYQGEADYRPASRYAWVSSDYGSTFTVVYDLNDPATNDGVNGPTSHLHATEVDRWHITNGTPRLWLSHHDYDNGSGIGGQRVRYSDDLGQTWTTVESLADTPDGQPTVIIATEQSILLGSDGQPDGVLRLLRTKDGLSDPERIWTWRTDALGLSFICRKGTIGDDGLAHFAFRSRKNGVPGVVVSSDGVRAMEVYRTPAPADNQPFVFWASVVGGEFVARTLTTGTGGWDEVVRGTAPGWGPVAAAGSGGASTLDDLSDVDLSTAPVTGQALTYNGADWAADDIAHGVSSLPIVLGYIACPYVTVDSNTQPLNRMTATPLWITRPTTISELAIEVTVASAAGGVFRLGIYRTHPKEGHPDALLIDAGTVPADATGTQAVAVDVTLEPGLYWLAAVAQVDATGSVRRVGTAAYTLATALLPGAALYTGWRQDSVSGSLPDPALGGAGLNRKALNPTIVWAKVSAVT